MVTFANSSSFRHVDECYFGWWFLQRAEYCIDDGLTRIDTMMNFMMTVFQHWTWMVGFLEKTYSNVSDDELYVGNGFSNALNIVSTINSLACKRWIFYNGSVSTLNRNGWNMVMDVDKHIRWVTYSANDFLNELNIVSVMNYLTPRRRWIFWRQFLNKENRIGNGVTRAHMMLDCIMVMKFSNESNENQFSSGVTHNTMINLYECKVSCDP